MSSSFKHFVQYRHCMGVRLTLHMITAKFFLQSFYLARFTPFSLEHFQLNIIYSTPPPTSTLHPTPPHPPTSTLHPTPPHPLHLLPTPPHPTPYIYSPPHPTPPPTSTLHPTPLHPLHLLSTPPQGTQCWHLPNKLPRGLPVHP